MENAIIFNTCAVTGEAVRQGVVDALDGWQQLDLPLDHALAVTASAWVVPGRSLPAAHLELARTTLDGLGARGLLARLDDALARDER